jgi:predicted SprT family Zn-dependent metalloprotease
MLTNQAPSQLRYLNSCQIQHMYRSSFRIQNSRSRNRYRCQKVNPVIANPDDVGVFCNDA